MITKLLPLTNYISGTENEIQRALLGHTNGNIEMRSPSAAAMLTMVAAATIVRFPPLLTAALCDISRAHCIPVDKVNSIADDVLAPYITRLSATTILAMPDVRGRISTTSVTSCKFLVCISLRVLPNY